MPQNPATIFVLNWCLDVVLFIPSKSWKQKIYYADKKTVIYCWYVSFKAQKIWHIYGKAILNDESEN